MATHSSTLAWKIPWVDEPGRLQSTGSLRVRHDWATSLSCIGEGNGNPLQCPCLENPRDGVAWWAAVSGVTQSQTGLKRLSSSSSKCLIEFSCEAIWSWAFFFWEIFDHSFCFSACNGLFIIFLPGSVLEDWTFLRNWPFLPGYLFYCHIVVHNSLLYSFLFLHCLL